MQQHGLLLCVSTKNKSIKEKQFLMNENERVATVTKEREEKRRGCGWKCVHEGV